MIDAWKSVGAGPALIMWLTPAAYIPTMSDRIGLRRFDSVVGNWMLARILWYGCDVAEIIYPSRRFLAVSSINRMRRIIYGTRLFGRRRDFLLREVQLFPE